MEWVRQGHGVGGEGKRMADGEGREGVHIEK